MKVFTKFEVQLCINPMYTATRILHKGEKRIAVSFEKNTELIERFKKLEGAKWSASLKTWHLPDTEEYRLKFKLSERRELSTEREQEIEKYIKWLRSKRYSENTVKTYTEAIRIFLQFFSEKQLAEIGNEDIIFFKNDYTLKNKLSASYQNQVVNAVKLFFQT